MTIFDPNQAVTAQAAYLQLLKSKGAATSILTRRKHFLRNLVTTLESQTDKHITDGDAGYRYAVDLVLHRFPDDQQVEIITTAREFYPFWTGDLKTIARLNAADAISLAHPPIDLQGNLIEMFERLNADPWALEEHPSLAVYMQQLVEQGTDNAVRDIRERLLTLLLYIIRHTDDTPMAYRAGVDAMLTLFSNEDSRRVFTDLAREFFYCWHGTTRADPLARAA
ncbi:hypothetical protein [Chitinimonas sp. BJB300]|uniref:hypothetical protein n=1 Tax=Chitinimonas sp. BJB300 TaxID=1559339 RepID=UPI001111F58E|nr:hypothetical protein [Chitinimonas sp. BJB300]